MLTYLGSGKRDYYSKPIQPYSRRSWEIETVIHGSCAPLLSGGLARRLRSRTLWVFPPDLPHGWTGEAGRPCRVRVFHVQQVPELLERAVRQAGFIELELSENGIGEIEGIFQEFRTEIERPSPIGPVAYQKNLYRLAHLILQGLPQRLLGRSPRREEDMVYRGLGWFEAHIGDSPRISDVARHLACSESHLRRIFHRVLGKAPRRAFEEIQLKLAGELLLHSELSVEEIAYHSGYSALSVFSRAFQRSMGRSPSEWRRGSGKPSINFGNQG